MTPWNKKTKIPRKKAFENGREVAEKRGEERESCLKVFKNGKEQILSSFDFPWSNGFVEGSQNHQKNQFRHVEF